MEAVASRCRLRLLAIASTSERYWASLTVGSQEGDMSSKEIAAAGIFVGGFLVGVCPCRRAICRGRHVDLPGGSQGLLSDPFLILGAVSGCLADYACAAGRPRALWRSTLARVGGVSAESMWGALRLLGTLQRRHVQTVLGMVQRGGRQVGRCPCAEDL